VVETALRKELRRELARLLRACAVLVEAANEKPEEQLERPRRASARRRTQTAPASASMPDEVVAARAAAALRRAGVRS
jgi:hypothetical protein